jgi:hypothetical protein
VKLPRVDLHPEHSNETLAFQRLAVAIIKSSVADLVGPNETDARDARRFLFGQTEELRKWRRHWFDQAGLTEQGAEWMMRKAFEWKKKHDTPLL